jgi:hypothetical protein
MYEVRETGPEIIPALDAPIEFKMECWMKWAALELQIRALLGYYILDGQIAQFSGKPTCVRHTTNPLSLSNPTTAFDARTVDEWIEEMGQETQPSVSFRESILSLFRSHDDTVAALPLSGFATQVVLEGLQSLVVEETEGGGFAIGVPSKADLGLALYRVREDNTTHFPNTSARLLRWHSICLSLIMDTGTLCRTISDLLGVEQSLFGPSETRLRVRDVELQEWVQGTDFRRAILHASAIHDILQNLPVSHACEIHVPSSTLSAAAIYWTLAMTGTAYIVLPPSIDWRIVCCYSDEMGAANNYVMASLETQLFIEAKFLPANPRPLTRRVSSELHDLRISLRTILSPWGVSRRMEQMIEQWSAKLQKA